MAGLSASCKSSFSEFTTQPSVRCAVPWPGAELARQNERFVVKVYTVEEVAAILRVDYKTVLRLIQRGLLKVLPGIRHKRVTEEELKRYLDVRNVLCKPIQTPAVTFVPAVRPLASDKSTKPAGKGKAA